MGFKKLVAIVGITAVAAVATVACGDPGQDALLNGSGRGNARANAPAANGAPGVEPGAPADSTSGSGMTAPGAGSGTPSDSDAGGASPTVDPSLDAGLPPADADAAAPPPSGVFAGAPAFVASVSGRTHNAGKNCMSSCHNHGFTFAGTITNAAGAAVAGAEVRLVDATGAAISVHTGPTGNFHSSTPFTAPAKVAARDATNVATMVTALQATSGACNTCHATGGTTAPIHLP